MKTRQDDVFNTEDLYEVLLEESKDKQLLAVVERKKWSSSFAKKDKKTKTLIYPQVRIL